MRHAFIAFLLMFIAFSAFSLGDKPSILFSCPHDMRYAAVSYDYMRELNKQGFEVDYAEGSAPITLERLKQYHAVVVFSFPPEHATDTQWLFSLHPPFLDTYLDALKQYAEVGGSVFFMITSNGMSTSPNDFLKQWGLQLPTALVHDPTAQPMNNLPKISLAQTTRIEPSPVSEGVKAIWYPLGQHYVGAHTMPVLVDDQWTVVARIGRGAYTTPPVVTRGGNQPRPGLLMPEESIPDAPLMAIRDLPAGGRMAAMQIWSQWHVGSGTKWLYDNQVLEKGVGGRPSDLGKLLLNTMRWLTEKGSASETVGGYVGEPDRLLEAQLRPGAAERFHEWVYEEEEIKEYRRPPMNGKLYKGLIGARTAYSGGQGTVEEYAKAAKAAGLDFVIFCEVFAEFSEEKLKQLTAECARLTDDQLFLIPGYRIDANIGNHLFFYSTEPIWPEDRLLTGPDKTLFNLQYQNEMGEYAQGGPAIDFCLSPSWHRLGNVGYYDFSHSGDGMRMSDLRLYSAAAVRTYQDGKVIDDALDDYLTTCQSTSVPSPINMALIDSPEELTETAVAGNALTWAQARELKLLITDALRWTHSLDGVNVFATDGPIIHAWPKLHRVMTFGAERFVSGRSLNFAPLHVTSDVGLKEISIYNGQNLFRRFICNGDKDFETTLFLSGVVQRSLVLVAEDIQGGRAVSFAHRSFKDASLCPIFCSDHVNDCGHMLLAHGPNWPVNAMFPTLPVHISGNTWDGGAGLARRPMNVTSEFTMPLISSDKGTFGERPYQTPLLEYSDEGTTRCRSIGGRRLAPESIRSWANAWSGYGPLIPHELFDAWASHAYFGQYSLGVDPVSYGSPGIMAGPISCLFTEEFTWKQEASINYAQIWHSGWRQKDAGRSVLLAVGNRDGSLRDVIDIKILPDKSRNFQLQTGDWFAFYSSEPANTSLFINRGDVLRLQLNPPSSYWIRLFGDLDGKAVAEGETYRVETFSVAWPLDQMITNAATLGHVVSWLDQPTGLELVRGQRGPRNGGLFELTPEDSAIEIKVPQEQRFSAVLPVRINDLNPRWTAGLYQVNGYRNHTYSKGNSGWTELGLDLDGRAYFPVYASMAKLTHMRAGQPIVADAAGSQLFIQVTRINDGIEGKPPAWHVSVNNPTDSAITTTIRQSMELPGLQIPETQVTLQPGELRVIAGTPAE